MFLSVVKLTGRKIDTRKGLFDAVMKKQHFCYYYIMTATIISIIVIV